MQSVVWPAGEGAASVLGNTEVTGQVAIAVPFDYNLDTSPGKIITYINGLTTSTPGFPGWLRLVPPPGAQLFFNDDELTEFLIKIAGGSIQCVANADGTVIRIINTSMPMTGATETEDGKPGLVPAASIADRNKMLLGDGSYSPPFDHYAITTSTTIHPTKDFRVTISDGAAADKNIILGTAGVPDGTKGFFKSTSAFNVTFTSTIEGRDYLRPNETMMLYFKGGTWHSYHQHSENLIGYAAYNTNLIASGEVPYREPNFGIRVFYDHPNTKYLVERASDGLLTADWMSDFSCEMTVSSRIIHNVGSKPATPIFDAWSGNPGPNTTLGGYATLIWVDRVGATLGRPTSNDNGVVTIKVHKI